MQIKLIFLGKKSLKLLSVFLKTNLNVFDRVTVNKLLNSTSISNKNRSNFFLRQITKLNRMNRSFNNNIMKPKPIQNRTGRHINRVYEIAWEGRVKILNDPNLPVRVIGWDPKDFGCALVFVADAERAGGVGIRVWWWFGFEIGGSFWSCGWEDYPSVVNWVFAKLWVLGFWGWRWHSFRLLLFLLRWQLVKKQLWVFATKCFIVLLVVFLVSPLKCHFFLKLLTHIKITN